MATDRKLPARTGRKRRAPARAIGSFVPKITGKAFGKYGFAAVALITDWSTIVGRELAAFTEPEQLKWPRQPADATAEEASARGRQGATLVLRVDGPIAIEVQHKTPQIIQRINAYFGYCAVDRLRIIQAPITRNWDAMQQLSPAQAAAPSQRPETAGIEDERLRHALERLGAGIAERKNAQAD